MEGLTGRETSLPSVFEAADFYDEIFQGLDFDLPFWLSVGRDARGPVLDLACGTGRVLLALLEAGADADGVDLYPAMLERARAKATARGFAPRLVAADMQDFTMTRRYARVVCAFNGFAHADTTEAQLAALRCVREHLEPEGAFVLHLSYPGHAYWAEPDGQPVMELETAPRPDGHRFQMWDTRTKDPLAQRQRSVVEYRELDASGAVVSSRRLATTQRWVYRHELELLFRCAGYARWEIFGGFAGEPLTRDDQQMVAWAWKS